MTKAIKISDENYRNICAFAGELQKELGEPVSVDKALSALFKKKKLSEFAGSWKMSDKEASDMFESLRKGWGTWNIKSV